VRPGDLPLDGQGRVRRDVVQLPQAFDGRLETTIGGLSVELDTLGTD
jgi:hypothetical protein